VYKVDPTGKGGQVLYAFPDDLALAYPGQGVVLDAVGRAPFQLLDKQWMTIGPFCEARFRHFVIRQTIFQRAFTELGQIGQCRQDDIRGDAVKLGGSTGDTIKFLNR